MLRRTESVGIGTNSPSGILDVVASSASALNVLLVADNGNQVDDTWTLNIPTSGGTLSFINNAVTRFSLGSTGVLNLTNYITEASGNIEVRAPAGALNFLLAADNGNQADDTWTLNIPTSGGTLSFINNAATQLSLGNTGILTVSNYITEASGNVELRATSTTDINLLLAADNGNQANDTWTLQAVNGGTLNFINNASTYLSLP